MALSARAYARHRGVSHTAVQKALRAGRIVALPDGTIDPTVGDAAWNAAAEAARGNGTAPADPRRVVLLPARPPWPRGAPGIASARLRRCASTAVCHAAPGRSLGRSPDGEWRGVETHRLAREEPPAGCRRICPTGL